MTHEFNYAEERKRRVIERSRFFMLDCGYYHFDFDQANGLASSYDLRIIADELDRINAEWDKSITDYFANNPKSPSCE